MHFKVVNAPLSLAQTIFIWLGIGYYKMISESMWPHNPKDTMRNYVCMTSVCDISHWIKDEVPSTI